MAEHLRKQIRTTVRDMLAADPALGTLLGNSGTIHRSRVYDLPQAKLPAIIIYTQDESSDFEEQYQIGDGRPMERIVALFLDIIVQKDAQTDDVLDAFALEIERIMEANETISGLAWNSQLAETRMDFSSEGETETAGMRLNYAVNYRTIAGDAAKPIE